MQEIRLADDLVILQGDVRAGLAALPAESVQCAVTSPPYWGLRNYQTPPQVWGEAIDCAHEWGGTVRHADANSIRGPGGIEKNVADAFCQRCGAWRGHLGMEPTPDQYVANLVEVFRHVRRALRPDGTVWLNMGDSYNGSGGAGGDYGPGGLREGQPRYSGRRVQSLKAKDLVGLPWRVALALQAAGWYLRCDIIWSKPNCFPESAKDRPTRSHEYVFLLSKSERYFYDGQAIQEPTVSGKPTKGEKVPAAAGFRRQASKSAEPIPGQEYAVHRADRQDRAPTGYRNKRSVWTVPTLAYRGAHFATFPPNLIEPCILAGTSPKACPTCGAPWRREVEVVYTNPGNRTTNGPRSIERRHESPGFAVRLEKQVTTTGWAPTCGCEDNDGSGKCVVLDPFFGSGTTALVALAHGRKALGCELNPAYVQLAVDRLTREQQSLPGV